MILYDGTKKVGKVSYIKFKNENNSSVEIPVDDRVLAQFMVYFEKLQPNEPKPIEWGNDESSE